MRRRLAAITTLAVLAGCSGDGPTGPRISSVTVVANPNMVVAATVRYLGTGDSVRVRYHVAAATGDSVTPATANTGDTLNLPVLGLLPQTAYVFRAVAFRGGDSAVSDSVTLTTGALPADLPSYTAGALPGGEALSGYVVFSATPYGLVIDRTGRVVWYRSFAPGGPSLNFMAEPTGEFVGRPATPDPNDVDPFVVVDPTGAIVRTVTCGNARVLRFHDIILMADGSAWLMCDDVRTVNLTAFGGASNATVTGTVVQHVSATGAVLFEWNAFDHFAFDDADSLTLLGANVNWTHGNSLDLDTDGNLLVSFRSLNEITKINTQTGAIVWRMGGRRGQFAFSGAPDPGFSRQHNVRVIGPGRFIVLDNVGGPDSRYERYAWNTGTMTAQLEQSYGASPGVTTALGGSVQMLAPDRFLVSFGTQGRVELFDPAGTRLWQINGNPGYVFRAQRILSLYHPIPALTR